MLSLVGLQTKAIISKTLTNLGLTVLGLVLFSLAACSTPPKIVADRDRTYAIKASVPIYVIPSLLTFEQLKNADQPLKKTDAINKISLWIDNLILQEMRKKGFAKTALYAHRNASTQHLIELSEDLVRLRPLEETLNKFMAFCEQNDFLTFIHHVKVKVGRDRSWELYGLPPIEWHIAPRVQNSNALLRGVIRRCPDGAILWRHKVLVRSIPVEDDADFKKAIGDLLSNLRAEE